MKTELMASLAALRDVCCNTSLRTNRRPGRTDAWKPTVLKKQHFQKHPMRAEQRLNRDGGRAETKTSRAT